MKSETVQFNDHTTPCISADAVVVGSGAASLNAAVQLKRLGVEDVVIVTERLRAGTSANTGSDKQTYYRLNPFSKEDSVQKMAEDLFSGSCMHGDIAKVEAALSTRCFYNLVELGVPFPQNQFGEFTGFQTDHDEVSRGTSAGPKTSIMMVEKLLEEVERRQIPILDYHDVVELLVEEQNEQTKIVGLISVDPEETMTIIKSDYIVFGTGGPGGLYADSVYPYSQIGSLGIALKAGAAAQNLTESQFGIASLGFRWNLSGSYQQVLPRYISTDENGEDSKDFLTEYFPSVNHLYKAQFLKGYQWPFDIRKLSQFGSSLIDLAVYHESKILGRTIYMDFRDNPVFPEAEYSFDNLPPVIKEYLEKSGATGDRPVDRLKKMNLPAYQLFKENGIDLETRPVEVAVCHQHCNGGLTGSIWWESTIANFFPVGECNGSHGLYRPGGSALNAGQVGSIRAAEMIHYRLTNSSNKSQDEFSKPIKEKIEEILTYYQNLTDDKKPLDLKGEREFIQNRMSETLGIVRSPEKIEKAILLNKQMQN